MISYYLEKNKKKDNVASLHKSIKTDYNVSNKSDMTPKN